jgi:hypothetical protein
VDVVTKQLVPNAEVLKLWGAPQGAQMVLWGLRVDCMTDIFILNEIWVKGKIYFDSHFVWLKYIFDSEW